MPCPRGVRGWGASCRPAYYVEMDDAGVYERFIADPRIRPLVAKTYAAWMNMASQRFLRDVTPELIQALSSAG